MNETAGKRGVAGVMTAVSGLGLLVAAVTVLTTLRTELPSPDSILIDPAPLYGMANGWLALVIGLLLLPSFIDSIRLLRGSHQRVSHLRASLKLVSLLLVLAAVAAVYNGEVLKLGGWFGYAATSFFQIYAVIIPIWWFLELGRSRLPALSARRGWAITGISLVLTMPLVMIIELVIMGIVLIGVGVWITNQPDLLQQFNALRQIMQTSGNDPETILPYLQNFIRQPGVVLGLAAMVGGVMPLVEELLKPLGLWAFALTRRKLTPAEGFVGGLICGAVFALLESGLRLSGLDSSIFDEAALGRFGSDMLHMTCSALVGWGLGLAWTEGRYLRLGVQFIAAVALHCAWNLAALLPALEVYQAGSAAGDYSTILSTAMPLVLVAEVVVFIVVIVRGRNALRATLPPAPPLPPAVADETGLVIISEPDKPAETPPGTNLD